MTAQIPDTLLIESESFSIIKVRGEGLFHPQSIGIKPVCTSSACWRGYECHYAIEDGQLLLRRLVVPISAGAVKLGRVQIFGKKPEIVRPRRIPADEKFLGIGIAMHEISDISIPISFSGQLLAGRDLDASLYVHMGLQSAYKYRRLKQLTFDSGALTSLVDRSQDAEAIRATIPSTTEGFPDRQLKWTTQDLEFMEPSS